MARAPAPERWAPSLLDRLTDDAPQSQRESRETRVMSVQQLRASVIRDLGFLLNTPKLEIVEPLEAYPLVARSVLNYGVRPASGRTTANLEARRVEEQMRQAIWDFEPRLVRESVKVRLAESGSKSGTTLTFFIEAQLHADPAPIHLALKTEVDTDTGDVAVSDASGRGAR